MIYLQILQDEKYLEKTFGEEYLNYKKHFATSAGKNESENLGP